MPEARLCLATAQAIPTSGGDSVNDVLRPFGESQRRQAEMTCPRHKPE